MKTIFLILAIFLSVNVQALNIKEVEYRRHEPHYDPAKIEAPLLTFVYDIPYLSACGIFPPLLILNEIFAEGGSQGGMSPGATWEPFSITQKEYDSLWDLVERTEPLILKNEARYVHVKFVRDRELESIKGRFDWMKKACDKHRDEFLRKQNKAFDI